MEHLSLHELNKLIGEVLAKNLEPSYWVVAEIGEMRLNQKGHCYLELVQKEDTQILAKSRATIWSYTYRNLSGWFEALTGQQLRAGMNILCNVTIQFHEVYGFSLNIRDIDAQYTLGERAKRRQEIILQLQSDGIFEMNNELELPLVPQRIAVVSSETAAGFGDFMDQLNSNEYGYHFEVELYNSVMQGDQAEQSIIQAMHSIYEKAEAFDLLIIIRGGGAALDLDCFDSYELGSHIAQFPLPVITGIGHERDETIADLVAHTKMKTPTAVAEFIISGTRDYEAKLMEHGKMLAATLAAKIEAAKGLLDQLVYNFRINSLQLLTDEKVRLNSYSEVLKFGYQHVLNNQAQSLENFTNILSRLPQTHLKSEEQKLGHLQKELDAINPENVLKRGYSFSTINGQNVKKLKTVTKGDKMKTLSHKFELESEVISGKEIKKK